MKLGKHALVFVLSHLQQKELSAYYVSPKFNLYDGTGDPTEHIYYFQQLMHWSTIINDCCVDYSLLVCIG